jgi:hypothetical protein
MSDTLAPKLSATRRVEIDAKHHQLRATTVYSTPNLLYDIEMACRDLLLGIEAGKDSVGTGRTRPPGRDAVGHGGDHRTLAGVTGGAVSFDFARDAVGRSRSKHNRFIVGVERPRAAQTKQARAG